MKIDDFEQVHSLWMEIHGFGIRSIDDSKEGVERFIRRNPTTSMVAVCDGKLSVQSSAGMMAGEQDFIMSVYRKITETRNRAETRGAVSRSIESRKNFQSQSDRLQAERDRQPLLAEPRLEILRQRELL